LGFAYPKIPGCLDLSLFSFKACYSVNVRLMNTTDLLTEESGLKTNKKEIY